MSELKRRLPGRPPSGIRKTTVTLSLRTEVNDALDEYLSNQPPSIKKGDFVSDAVKQKLDSLGVKVQDPAGPSP